MMKMKISKLILDNYSDAEPKPKSRLCNILQGIFCIDYKGSQKKMPRLS